MTPASIPIFLLLRVKRREKLYSRFLLAEAALLATWLLRGETPHAQWYLYCVLTGLFLLWLMVELVLSLYLTLATLLVSGLVSYTAFQPWLAWPAVRSLALLSWLAGAALLVMIWQYFAHGRRPVHLAAAAHAALVVAMAPAALWSPEDSVSMLDAALWRSLGGGMVWLYCLKEKS